MPAFYHFSDISNLKNLVLFEKGYYNLETLTYKNTTIFTSDAHRGSRDPGLPNLRFDILSQHQISDRKSASLVVGRTHPGSPIPESELDLGYETFERQS